MHNSANVLQKSVKSHLNMDPKQSSGFQDPSSSNSQRIHSEKKKKWMGVGRVLVRCFGFSGPLRQYLSLYRAVSQREGERGEKRIDESKNVQTTLTCTYYKRSRPLSYCHQNCRTPRHWKFIQHLHTTRPPRMGRGGGRWREH